MGRTFNALLRNGGKGVLLPRTSLKIVEVEWVILEMPMSDRKRNTKSGIQWWSSPASTKWSRWRTGSWRPNATVSDPRSVVGRQIVDGHGSWKHRVSMEFPLGQPLPNETAWCGSFECAFGWFDVSSYYFSLKKWTVPSFIGQHTTFQFEMTQPAKQKQLEWRNQRVSREPALPAHRSMFLLLLKMNYLFRLMGCKSISGDCHESIFYNHFCTFRKPISKFVFTLLLKNRIRARTLLGFQRRVWKNFLWAVQDRWFETVKSLERLPVWPLHSSALDIIFCNKLMCCWLARDKFQIAFQLKFLLYLHLWKKYNNLTIDKFLTEILSHFPASFSRQSLQAPNLMGNLHLWSLYFQNAYQRALREQQADRPLRYPHHPYSMTIPNRPNREESISRRWIFGKLRM